MNSDEPRPSLSSISTMWTVVCRAHEGSTDGVSTAQSQLLHRYSRAVHRYLLGALHDAEAADELSQEFALRFIRGDFRRADPQRGRFRDFVKGVLSHLVADHFRKKGRSPSLPPVAPEPAAPDPASDKEFLRSWRDELLQHAWDGLAELEGGSGKPFHTVLRFRTDHPELRSNELAEQLSARLGMRVTPVWVRQALHRAREKFIDLLVRAVLETMSKPTIDELEGELGELGLLKYCAPALKRLRGER
jgi:RNA polymerase sigma-70 factor (ECF subfamily)